MSFFLFFLSIKILYPLPKGTKECYHDYWTTNLKFYTIYRNDCYHDYWTINLKFSTLYRKECYPCTTIDRSTNILRGAPSKWVDWDIPSECYVWPWKRKEAMVSEVLYTAPQTGKYRSERIELEMQKKISLDVATFYLARRDGGNKVVQPLNFR